MDVMIDLETLGTDPRCPVISIGAIAFDVEKKALGPTFYATLDVAQQIRAQRFVDADTLKWWMGQSDAAKKVFRDTASPVEFALPKFVEYLGQFKDLQVWGNGSTFDITILENIMAQWQIKVPWKYNKIMDLRTFRRFVAGGETLQKSGVDHNALDDAKSQAEFVLKHL